MSNDLHLGLHPGGNDLHLGYTGAPTAACVLLARTAAPRAQFRAATGRTVLAARTRSPKAVLRAAYDPNLLSDTVRATTGRWAGAGRQHHGCLSVQTDARPLPQEAACRWQEGRRVPGGAVAAWAGAEPAAGENEAAWRVATMECGTTGSAWAGAPRVADSARAAWQEGDATAGPAHATWWRGLPLVDLPASPLHRDAGRELSSVRDRFRHGRLVQDPCIENSWNDGAWVGYVRRKPVPWVRPPRPWVPRGNDLHLCNLEPGNDFHLGSICRCRIPRRRSYHVQHSIAVVRLSDSAEVPTESLSLSLDADSWAWTWSAGLLGPDALALVLPSELGEPVTLEAAIDGHVWHLVVEDWQEDRSFGSRSVKVSGRGLSAWLGQPYEPAASGSLANARTLNQAIEEFLPLGSGWTIDWADDTPDWLLPSGSWSWTNQAPIQVIHEAVQGVGMVAVPGATAKTLTIQPRYPVLPWDFAAATPDLIIPDSAILNLSRRQAVPTQANAVYVHGGDSGGILARVWRSGTAGDRLAPTVSDSRITHADGARLLGSRLLAAQTQQPEIRSVTIPCGGVFCLASIGQLVSITIGASDIRGIVNAVSISAQGGTVRQTITIGEETPNVWAMWRSLLPASPLLWGQVLAVHEDGTRTVSMAGGGTQRVRGDGSAGAAVWVRAGVIEGQAPQLPVEDIEIP